MVIAGVWVARTFKICSPGFRDAQSVECSRTWAQPPETTLGVVTDNCETSTGTVETDRFLGSTGQPSLAGELQADERPCLKNKAIGSEV